MADPSELAHPSAPDMAWEAMRRDIRALNAKRRRDLAHRFFDALRAVREETGYGAVEDAVAWATRIVEGRGDV